MSNDPDEDARALVRATLELDDPPDGLELEDPVEVEVRRRRRVRSGPRPKVLARRELRLAVSADRNVRINPRDDAARPQTRADCVGTSRPCPWVSCKHHLYLSVNPINGSIIMTFPDREPWELTHSCALDVADRGGITLEEVGEILNLTRERIRQVEVKGLLQLKHSRSLREQ